MIRKALNRLQWERLPQTLQIIRLQKQQHELHTICNLPQCFQQAITPEVCQHLISRGYAVVDGIFGNIASHQLKLELERLHTAGLMHLNHTHLVQQGQTRLLPKSHIYEAELSLDTQIQAAAPLVSQLDADRSLATLLSLFIPQLRLESHALKMQFNDGNGGCFPMHFDSDEQLDGRRVTAIFYLNETWTPDVGGALRLYPFPAPPIDIAPIRDRLVLFSTARMLHRVLPSQLPRCCFTMWLSEGLKPQAAAAAAAAAAVPPPPPPDRDNAAQGGDALWSFLMQPAVRQHVCKLAYADEWAQSIAESHPASEETAAALRQHQQEVEVIKKALGKYQTALQQLLDAADIVARAAAVEVATATGATAAATGKTSGRGRNAEGAERWPVAPAPRPDAAAVSDDQLQQATSLLRHVARHVKWF